jgi:hypothetical protein
MAEFSKGGHFDDGGRYNMKELIAHFPLIRYKTMRPTITEKLPRNDGGYTYRHTD